MKTKLCCLLALGVAACDTSNEPPVMPPIERLRPEVSVVSLPDMPEGHPDLGALQVLSRGPRRMSVEQLERSLDAVIQAPPGTVKLDDSLALALGRPDYLRVTEESLVPSPLFMKFMMDLGGYMCTAISDAEAMRPAEQRVMTRFTEVDENLEYMLIRFLGLEGAAADEYMPRLRRVYEAGKGGARGEMGGYEAVCLALFASPEFLLY